MVTAVAIQPRIRVPYPDATTFDSEAIGANVDTSIAHIAKAKSEHGADLVAFPEFFLTGYTVGVDVAGWIKASIQIPGPETDRLCEAAVEHNVYVAGTAYERHDAFPGRFFNTSFIIDPKGEMVLVYRKVYAMTTKTRPIDVLDKFIETFGEDSLFPVADTNIGRIGVMIARDAHWPEMGRTLALKGAEIFYVPNAAGAEYDDGGRLARASRAYENHAYVISPNIGPMSTDGSDVDNFGRAPSEIIDYRGRVIAKKQEVSEFVLPAEIDIESLRAYRIDGCAKGNFLAQLQPQLHVPFYQNADLFPANAWRDTPIADNAENTACEQAILERMLRDGILVAPSDKA